MSVVRIKKVHTKPYVLLDMTALNDAALSFRAKGLHTYLMTKPDDWQVYIEQLEEVSPREGRDAIRAALKELESGGYIRRSRIRGAKGHMAGWDTTVYETPALAEDQPKSDQPKSDQPKSDQPKSDQPKSANPQLPRIDLNQGLKVVRTEEENSLPTVGSSHDDVSAAQSSSTPPASKTLRWLQREIWETKQLGHMFDLLSAQEGLWQRPGYILDGQWWDAVDAEFDGQREYDCVFLQAQFDKMRTYFLRGERRPNSARGWKKFVRAWLAREFDFLATKKRR